MPTESIEEKRDDVTEAETKLEESKQELTEVVVETIAETAVNAEVKADIALEATAEVSERVAETEAELIHHEESDEWMKNELMTLQETVANLSLTVSTLSGAIELLSNPPISSEEPKAEVSTVETIVPEAIPESETKTEASPRSEAESLANPTPERKRKHRIV